MDVQTTWSLPWSAGWNASVGRLVLPEGWFGRPFDNRHRLTWVDARGSRLLIELDEQLLLSLTNPTLVDAAGRMLVLAGEQIVFGWQEEYGSRVPTRASSGPTM